MNPEVIQNQILDETLTCSSCVDIGTLPKWGKYSDSQKLEYFKKNLPGLDYVASQIINYMFSNGLAAGSAELDGKLDEWIYSMNGIGATNYLTLQSAISNAIVYGENGLWMRPDGLRSIEKGYYGTLLKQEDGLYTIMGYVVRDDGEKISEEYDFKSVFEMYPDLSPSEAVSRWLGDGYIVVPTDEFVNLRNDITKIHGYSPLLKDQQRLALIASVYERLNYDINYDGPGRIIIRPKDGYMESEDNQVSSSMVLNQSAGAQTARYNKARQEAMRIGRELKYSTSDSVILMSNAFDKDIDTLPRVTKATEFLSWVDDAVQMIAQDLGMKPELLGLGKFSGNISLSAVIDDSMVNSIVPMRERYAVQFSRLISKRVGVDKVYFDKYDLQQAADFNDERVKMANVIRQLSLAKSYMVQSGDNGTGLTDLDKLIHDLSSMVDSSLYDSYGNMYPLA